jgi:hypothetical protein
VQRSDHETFGDLQLLIGSYLICDNPDDQIFDYHACAMHMRKESNGSSGEVAYAGKLCE